MTILTGNRLKLCINCKHHKISRYFDVVYYGEHFCHALPDPVTGGKMRFKCKEMRFSSGCGLEAKLYKSKKGK